MIRARVIADSIGMSNKKRITTFEVEYPRFIHSELMTHRALSKNAASSRAIPLAQMISSVWNNPAHPVHWGANQAGMQAKAELSGFQRTWAERLWFTSGKVMCCFAWAMGKMNVHKQIANRILEPWSHIKVVVTGTDWDNFFGLRTHPDAQPEFQALAKEMLAAYNRSKPEVLSTGEWHIPYVDRVEVGRIGISDCLKLSASLCAQVSFRKSDESIMKAIKIYNRLVESRPVHASPFEHQAQCMADPNTPSGNFRGWRQHRQIIAGNLIESFDGIKKLKEAA